MPPSRPLPLSLLPWWLPLTSRVGAGQGRLCAMVLGAVCVKGCPGPPARVTVFDLLAFPHTPTAAEEAAPTKPAAKTLGLAKPASKPAATAGAAAPTAAKAKAPSSKPKATKPAAAAATGEGAAEPAAKGPKRACNAFFIFVQRKRAEVKGRLGKGSVGGRAGG